MKLSDESGRIAVHLQTALAKSLSSMTGQKFVVSPKDDGEVRDSVDPIIWQQEISACAGPSLWIAADIDLWKAAGEMTLAAVGIDSVTDEDCRSTWQEILSQTVGSFCSAISVEVQQEVTATAGEVIEETPDSVRWAAFNATGENGTVWSLRMAWAPSVPGLFERSEPEQKAAVVKESAFSKTFDLLLDVALPVNVSFGRTSLQVREVLKLNTGSIVELNRFVAEPVEVVVNDCVIARGEVVVVDGNYGVRITQLSSREDRMRFGMAESARAGIPLR